MAVGEPKIHCSEVPAILNKTTVGKVIMLLIAHRPPNPATFVDAHGHGAELRTGKIERLHDIVLSPDEAVLRSVPFGVEPNQVAVIIHADDSGTR